MWIAQKMPYCPKCESPDVRFDVEALAQTVDDIELRVTHTGVALRTAAGEAFGSDAIDGRSLAHCGSCGVELMAADFFLHSGVRKRLRKAEGWPDDIARKNIHNRRRGAICSGEGLRGKIGGPAGRATR